MSAITASAANHLSILVSSGRRLSFALRAIYMKSSAVLVESVYQSITGRLKDNDRDSVTCGTCANDVLD